jgi:lipopolysaccharide transport system ATP-binding protein
LQFTLQEIYGDESKLTSITTAQDGDEANAEKADTNTEKLLAIDYGAVASVRDNIEAAKGWKTGQAEIISVSLAKLAGEQKGVFEGGERVRITIRAKAAAPMQNPILGFLVRDRLGQDLFGENTLSFTSRVPSPIGADMTFEGVFEFSLPMLANGEYAVMTSVADGDLHSNVQHHWLHDAMIINVSSSKIRWGLVGISFERVELKVVGDA